MQEFSNRVYEKLSKLSHSQIEILFNDLRKQNEMFKSTFQSLATGLVTVDKNWKLLEMNKAAERLLSLNQATSSDKRNENKKFFELIDNNEISVFFRDCFENNKTNISDEYTIVSSGGAVRFIEISVTPLVEGSEITGSIILIDDITEKRNQEILLHRMETLAGLTNIAASVAHEIKNPLGAISIHIQLMQKAIKKKREGDGLLPDRKFAENYLDIVNQEIDRLNKVVVDFLMAVRPISAQLTLVRPDEILKQFVSFITPEFAEKNIKIETSFCPVCPKLLIDEKLFREVIVNLAQNSLAAINEKFGEKVNFQNDSSVPVEKEEKNSNKSRKNNDQGRLEIKTSVKNDRFVIKFSDNGCGMNEEVMSRVFEPYYTTKVNGTGLGMAMSYKIIKEFSGDITVDSVEGEGTVFMIEIPVPQTKQKLLTHNSSGEK